MYDSGMLCRSSSCGVTGERKVMFMVTWLFTFIMKVDLVDVYVKAVCVTAVGILAGAPIHV